MENIMYAVLWFLLLGGALGYVLALLGKKLHVPEDERKEKLLPLLPGANCGGCGYAGCAAFADAVLNENAHPSLCGSLSSETADEICSLCGIAPKETEKRIAHVMCAGGNRAKEKYEYEGIRDCRVAAKLAGGNKLCHNGCTGLGNCERACTFDALHIIDGVARVDETKCRSCGVCVSACPKGIIKMIPASARFAVDCRSRDKGSEVIRACEAGCIGCKKCERVCEEGAIRVDGFCAAIDQSLCTSCGKCAEACPRGIIRKRKQI